MGSQIQTTVNVNLSNLTKFRFALENKSGEIGKAFTEWGAIYSSFIRKRFSNYSRGKGDWAALAPSTLKARRSRKGRTKKVKARILRDTGMLFAHLNPVQASGIAEIAHGIPFGIQINYGSSNSYPNGATITEVINFHDRGSGRLPQRKIFVDPDAKHIKLMGSIMEKAIKKELDLQSTMPIGTLARDHTKDD